MASSINFGLFSKNRNFASFHHFAFLHNFGQEMLQLAFFTFLKLIFVDLSIYFQTSFFNIGIQYFYTLLAFFYLKTFEKNFKSRIGPFYQKISKNSSILTNFSSFSLLNATFSTLTVRKLDIFLKNYSH